MIAREFTIPKYVKFSDNSDERYASIAVEPFERGYGTTVGNALRRVLLSSLEGTAVTAIRLEGISHEFSAIPGFQEDVAEVVLNLKRVQIRLNKDEPLIFTFKHSGDAPITVAELFKDVDVDVFNPDHVIMTAVSPKATIEMEIKVERGRGYVTAENLEERTFTAMQAPLGTIYLDANFSPVVKVNFQTEDARVGQVTDFDRLLLEIWTNGSLTPEKALEEASSLLMDHLGIFVKQEREGTPEATDGTVDDPELMKKLTKSVDELELSVRAANCLKSANIRTLAELVTRDENEMLQFHNFGKKSLDEIVAVLEPLELTLGMSIPGITPPPLPEPAMVAARMAEVGGDDADDDAGDTGEED